MNLIPYERITIKSSLSPADALKKLEENIQPRLPFFSWRRKTQKPYQGKIEGSHFSIRRIIFYRNSFLPMINGDIQLEMGVSSIRISMLPHLSVLIFMGIWLGGISIFFLVVLSNLLFAGLNGISSQPGSKALLIIPFGMILFGYAVSLAGFKYESNKSKAFLRDLFQATQVDETSLFDLFQAP